MPQRRQTRPASPIQPSLVLAFIARCCHSSVSAMDLMDGVAPPTAPQQQNPKYQLIGEESASEAVYLLAPKVKRSYRTPHFIDRRHLPELLTAARPLYAEWKNLLVWNKSNAGQGCFYRSKH